MPHPKKKQRLAGDDTSCLTETAVADQVAASANDLSIDVLADIFGFLSGAKEIMQKRRVCKKWKEAVKKTIAPLAEFIVDNMKEYNTMRVMTRALPNLQQIKLCTLRDCDDYYNDDFEHKYSDGEDPDEDRAARYAGYTTHDIEIISNFSKLRILDIKCGSLNGRYPFLFNSFPLLQKLSIQWCHCLKWDLEMLAGFPLLKELDCFNNDRLTGKIGSLRVLKDTLEKVRIRYCPAVEGNFMDLADFPHLKELDLTPTAVTGDIRDIGENDFSLLEELDLPKKVYGGDGYEFQRIADAPDLIRAVYLLKKQRPVLKMTGSNCGRLSQDSPEWYPSADYEDDTAPFEIKVVEAGSRLGYRWQTRYHDKPCEVNWLDPEPDRESSDYSQYIEESEQINSEVCMFRGFHQPPTEEEYHRLIEECAEESENFLESDNESSEEYFSFASHVAEEDEESDDESEEEDEESGSESSDSEE